MELVAKYAYTVYEKRSFSKAAKALFISQPALSLMIAKLESELGFKIFDRSRSAIVPTEKGRIYFDSLAEIRESENNMKRRIEQLTKPLNSRISISCSPHLAECILPRACQRFCELFPKTPIRLNMGSKGSKNVLTEILESGMVDFIFSTTYDEEVFDAILLGEMRTLIAVRRDYPGVEALLPYALDRNAVLSGIIERELGEEELSKMKNIGFITTDFSTAYRSRLDELVEGNYSLANISIHNIRHYGMNYQMMSLGMGATLAYDVNLSMSVFNDDNIVYFAPKTPKARQNIYAVYRKGEELSEQALSFIRLFAEVVNEVLNKKFLPDDKLFSLKK